MGRETGRLKCLSYMCGKCILNLIMSFMKEEGQTKIVEIKTITMKYIVWPLSFCYLGTSVY